jgi:hypothetical protein
MQQIEQQNGLGGRDTARFLILIPLGLQAPIIAAAVLVRHVPAVKRGIFGLWLFSPALELCLDCFGIVLFVDVDDLDWLTEDAGGSRMGYCECGGIQAADEGKANPADSV